MKNKIETLSASICTHAGCRVFISDGQIVVEQSKKNVEHLDSIITHPSSSASVEDP